MVCINPYIHIHTCIHTYIKRNKFTAELMYLINSPAGHGMYKHIHTYIQRNIHTKERVCSCAYVPRRQSGQDMACINAYIHTHAHTHTHIHRNAFLAVLMYLIGALVMTWYPLEAKQLHAAAFAFFYFQLLNILSVDKCVFVCLCVCVCVCVCVCECQLHAAVLALLFPSV